MQKVIEDEADIRDFKRALQHLDWLDSSRRSSRRQEHFLPMPAQFVKHESIMREFYPSNRHRQQIIESFYRVEKRSRTVEP